MTSRCASALLVTVVLSFIPAPAFAGSIIHVDMNASGSERTQKGRTKLLSPLGERSGEGEKQSKRTDSPSPQPSPWKGEGVLKQLLVRVLAAHPATDRPQGARALPGARRAKRASPWVPGLSRLFAFHRPAGRTKAMDARSEPDVTRTRINSRSSSGREGLLGVSLRRLKPPATCVRPPGEPNSKAPFVHALQANRTPMLRARR